MSKGIVGVIGSVGYVIGVLYLVEFCVVILSAFGVFLFVPECYVVSDIYGKNDEVSAGIHFIENILGVIV